MCPADTPIRTSAPASASCRVPVRPEGLSLSIRARCPLVSSMSGVRIPCRSTRMTSFCPLSRSSLAMAHPALPAPLMTIRGFSFFASFRAFSSAADTTIAVPCWSSWNTGMSSCSFRRRSTSKHLGAAMSSRLMPPKDGARAEITSTSRSVSWVSSTSGTASRPERALNSTHFPSITGIPASGPMLPSPSTAEPSEITAMV